MPPGAGLAIRLRTGPGRRRSSACAVHGPGRHQDIGRGAEGFAGDRARCQLPRVAQARPHAEDDADDDLYKDKGGQGVLRSLAEVCLRPGGGRRLRGEACAELAQQVPMLPGVLYHLGPGRRFGAEAPRHQPGAGRAGPRSQGPLSASGGPVPGPDGGLGHHRGGSGHPFEGPGGPGPVVGQKKQLQVHRALLLSRAIPSLSPRRREYGKLPGCRHPDAAARRGQGASPQVRRWRRAGGTGFNGQAERRASSPRRRPPSWKKSRVFGYRPPA
jgi:hypothetical protein